MKTKSFIGLTLTIVAAVAFALSSNADSGTQQTQSQPRQPVKGFPIPLGTNTASAGTTNTFNGQVNDVTPGNTVLALQGGAYSSTTNAGNINLPVYRTLDGVTFESAPFAFASFPLTANSATNPNTSIVIVGTNVVGKSFQVGGVGNTQSSGIGTVSNLTYVFIPLQ